MNRQDAIVGVVAIGAVVFGLFGWTWLALFVAVAGALIGLRELRGLRELLAARGASPAFVEHEPEREVSDQLSTIDACTHAWRPRLDESLECVGGCGITLRGVLASQPPATGMNWSRACLVTSR